MSFRTLNTIIKYKSQLIESNIRKLSYTCYSRPKRIPQIMKSYGMASNPKLMICTESSNKFYKINKSNNYFIGKYGDILFGKYAEIRKLLSHDTISELERYICDKGICMSSLNLSEILEGLRESNAFTQGFVACVILNNKIELLSNLRTEQHLKRLFEACSAEMKEILGTFLANHLCKQLIRLDNSDFIVPVQYSKTFCDIVANRMMQDKDIECTGWSPVFGQMISNLTYETKKKFFSFLLDNMNMIDDHALVIAADVDYNFGTYTYNERLVDYMA
jgi:hypothetical protein